MSKPSLSKLLHIVKKITCRETVKQINLVTTPYVQVLSGRCALITGGTSGIGYAIAQAFLASGAAVVITGRNQVKLDKAISNLTRKNPAYQVLGYVLDNSKVSMFETIFSSIEKQLQCLSFPPIDILVNNAGVNFKGMPEATEEEYDLVMDTNLKGAFFLSQLVGKYFVTKGIKGNILNIASASSLRPADSAYILSKWGLRSLTLGLAKSLVKYGITVNGIAPGPTATPMMFKEENHNMNLDRLPLGRYILPEEIAHMAVHLVSDLGKSVVGDIVYMTGGAGLLTYDDVPYSF